MRRRCPQCNADFRVGWPDNDRPTRARISVPLTCKRCGYKTTTREPRGPTLGEEEDAMGYTAACKARA